MRDELEIRLRQQALLAELGRRALADTAFDVLLSEAARLCAIGMEVNFCKILEYLPDRNCLLVRAGVGWHDGVVGHETIGADLGSPAGYALHTGKAVISNNLATDRRFRTPGILRDHGVGRALNVILLGDGKAWGVLEVDSDVPGDFSERDTDFLQGMANLLGVALERRQAEEALKKLNETLEQRIEQEVIERRQMEDALLQAQKMEAVGHLTGGVAHDFNNLLLVITGNLDRLAREVADDPRLEAFVASAQKAAVRGAQLTNQLLAFARRQTLRSEARPVNQLVHEFEVLTARMLGEAIDTEFLTDPGAGACLVDPVQFGSAMLNLFVNARDAMPDGGQLTIRTGNVVLDARTAARYADAEAMEYVFIEVADTGHGMPADVRRRATEPYFTTKASGKGTGLGLAQVHGFARQSGGFLTIASPPGGGARITIHLPRIIADAGAESAQAAPAMNGGTGRILVVEDDPAVRELVVFQLEELGYSALTAATGREALAVLESEPATHVDLLMTDIAMPGGMTGFDLVREARLRQPGLKAMVTSGHVSGGSAEDKALALPMLPKPYHLEDLARVVRATLLGT
jgi:signal transduction histidine kinase